MLQILEEYKRKTTLYKIKVAHSSPSNDQLQKLKPPCKSANLILFYNYQQRW